MSALTTVAGSCAASASCTASGLGHVHYWVSRVFSQQQMTGTVVVVQVVNTVLDTTSYSTIAENLPSGYVPPPTNERGTKIATVSYTRHGTVSTTTVAYPTPYLYFPDTYTIEGDYQLSGSSGIQRCIEGANKTFEVPTNPQPIWSIDSAEWNPAPFGSDPDDPLGWGYGYDDTNSSHSITKHISRLIDLLPDNNPDMPHEVVKVCKAGSIAAPYILSADSNWRVVAQTSVVYEGDDRVTESPTSTGSSSHSSKGRTLDGTASPGLGTQSTGGAGQKAGPPNDPVATGQRVIHGPVYGSAGRIKATGPLWAVLLMGSILAVSAGI